MCGEPREKMALLKVIALCVFSIAIVGRASTVQQTTSEKVVNTGIKCECGAFNSMEIQLTDSPLMTQNPINSTCDEAGEKMCKTICVNLVEVGKERAPQVLCEHLKHAEKLKPSLFTHVCDHKWTYGGITAEELLCCHDGKHVPCSPTA